MQFLEFLQKPLSERSNEPSVLRPSGLTPISAVTDMPTNSSVMPTKSSSMSPREKIMISDSGKAWLRKRQAQTLISLSKSKSFSPGLLQIPDLTPRS